VDENTGEITARVLTGNKTDDAAVPVDLVDKIFDQGIDSNKVGQDGAYDYYHCWYMPSEIDIELQFRPAKMP